jgi:hypothetical protein
MNPNAAPPPTDPGPFRRVYNDAHAIAVAGLDNGLTPEHVRQMGALQADAVRALALRAIDDAIGHRERSADAINEVLSGLGIDLHG